MEQREVIVQAVGSKRKANWTCSMCTYENAPVARECEVCLAQFDSLSHRVHGNTDEARRFFEANGFSFYPDAVSGADREAIQRNFFSVFNDA